MKNFKPGLPVTIIVDIDGTIARHVGRSPYDGSKCETDEPIEEIIDILHHYDLNPTIDITLFSGRSDEWIEETKRWLAKHKVPYTGLHMRKAGDIRKDSIVKREMFDEHIAGEYNVLFVLDDRNQVVDMWRKELGLTCLQVNYGDF